MTTTSRLLCLSLLATLALPPFAARAADAAGEARLIVRYTDDYQASAARIGTVLADAGYGVDMEQVDSDGTRPLGNMLRFKVLYLPGEAAFGNAVGELLAGTVAGAPWQTQQARPLVGTDGQLVDSRRDLRRGDGVRRCLVYLYPENDEARFFEAAAAGKTDAIVRLLAAGMDVNARDYSGSTALIIASREGRVEVVDTLLSAGADVNVRNQHDTTALLNAVYMNHLEVVRMLVANGADARVRNVDGSALEIAFGLAHLAIAEFLQQQLVRLEI